MTVQSSVEDRTKTHGSSELELEWNPLEEGRTIVVTACYKAVRTLRPDVYAVDYFGVRSEIPDRGAAVPEEGSSKPKPRDKTAIKLGHNSLTTSTLWQITRVNISLMTSVQCVLHDV